MIFGGLRSRRVDHVSYETLLKRGEPKRTERYAYVIVPDGIELRAPLPGVSA